MLHDCDVCLLVLFHFCVYEVLTIFVFRKTCKNLKELIFHTEKIQTTKSELFYDFQRKKLFFATCKCIENKISFTTTSQPPQYQSHHSSVWIIFLNYLTKLVWIFYEQADGKRIYIYFMYTTQSFLPFFLLPCLFSRKHLSRETGDGKWNFLPSIKI